MYDAGETFTDLGNAFRDDNENGVFDLGEFSVPRTGAVSSGNGCPGLLGQPGTCDGVWGAADVRRQANVIFATSAANIAGSFSGSTLSVTVSDLNGNSVPTGSTITARTSSFSCGLNGTSSTISNTVPNTLVPIAINYSTVGCASKDQIIIEVTTPLPSATATTKTFIFP